MSFMGKVLTAAALFAITLTSMAYGDIVVTGDIDPADPATWAADTSVYIGNTGVGTLDITNNSDVTCGFFGLGYQTGSSGEVTVDGAGSTVTTTTGIFCVGVYGNGTMNITNGAEVNSGYGSLGWFEGSLGEVLVDGVGSKWTLGRNPYTAPEDIGQLNVGKLSGGCGNLKVINGGEVSCEMVYIGEYHASSVGKVTVSGAGSKLVSGDFVRIGIHEGSGTLIIINDGLVIAEGYLLIESTPGNNSHINMATGGMLALPGDLTAPDAFPYLDSDIRYWDESLGEWSAISNATMGEDYTLEYMTDGDLAGYTVLTVTAVPEPASLTLLALGALAMIRRKRK